MGRRVWWAIAAFGLLLCGVAAIALLHVPRVDALVEITAAPGTRVIGSYLADGIVHDVETLAPTEIRCTAREFEYAVSSEDGSAKLTATLSVNGRFLFRAGGAPVAEGGWSSVRLFENEYYWAAHGDHGGWVHGEVPVRLP